MLKTQESPLVELDDLFGGKNFLEINGQLLFKKEGRYFMTKFSPAQNYTAKDYMELPEGAPFQLIHSKLIFMPSPTEKHQAISMALGSYIFQHVTHRKLGKVWNAPLDVHFDQNNIYQPDLLFIRAERLDIIDKFVHGAPDFVVEILSKSTETKDKNDKKATYAKYGVREYWLINPENQMVEVFILENNEMKSEGIFSGKDIIKSVAIQDFELKVQLIFD